MASTLTTFDPFLKRYYNPGQVTALVNKDRPFLAKIKKTMGSGNLWVTPVIFANPQGLSADLVNAQLASNQAGAGGNLQGKQWQSTWGDYTGAVSIGDKVIAASRDNVGAFFENQKAEIDRLYEQFADIMGLYSIGDSGHSVTPGTFTISSGVCTLVVPDDIVNIQVGMVLQASANPGTSTSDALIDPSLGYVIAVNENTGVFTISATSGGSAGTPANWTGTMYAFRNGDFGGTATPTRIMLGLSAWVPAADPSATSFEGVVRTAGITALSGVRLTAAEIAGVGIEQRIKKLVTRMVGRAKGPGPSDVFLNPEKWQALADSLESRGTRPLDGKIGTFNYQKVQLAAGGKMVDIWADRFCPLGRAFAVNFDYIEMKTLSGFPAVVNGDGLTMLRKTTSNDYEHRLVSYPAFQVKAPGYQGTTAV